VQLHAVRLGRGNKTQQGGICGELPDSSPRRSQQNCQGKLQVKSSRTELEGYPFSPKIIQRIGLGDGYVQAGPLLCREAVGKTRRDQKGLVSGGQGETDNGVFDGLAFGWLSVVGPVIARQRCWLEYDSMPLHVEPAVSV
jgi:hypothetical protein